MTPNRTNNYAYDANGSIIGNTNISTAGGVTTYSYDLMNKLSSVAFNGSTAETYQYNEQGIRVRKSISTGTNYYLIDASNPTGYQQVLEESTAVGGVPTISYVLGDDVLGQATSGAASYLLADGHGSTRQVADSSGAITSRYNYEAYGAVQTSTSSSTAEYAADNVTSHLYCREQYESKLQMYNLRSRYYDPANGRFNQRDSFTGAAGDPQSLHKYMYADCNPVNNVDPTGKFGVLDLLITAGIIGFVVGLCLPAASWGERFQNAILLAFMAVMIVDLAIVGFAVVVTSLAYYFGIFVVGAETLLTLQMIAVGGTALAATSTQSSWYARQMARISGGGAPYASKPLPPNVVTIQVPRDRYGDYEARYDRALGNEVPEVRTIARDQAMPNRVALKPLMRTIPAFPDLIRMSYRRQ